MPRVLNRHYQEGGTLVDRSTKWGNPFKLDAHSRDEAVALYEEYLATSGLAADLHELEGQDLACWCAPRPCHADILLRLANA